MREGFCPLALLKSAPWPTSPIGNRRTGMRHRRPDLPGSTDPRQALALYDPLSLVHQPVRLPAA